MAASDKRSRRRRYTRVEPARGLALTPPKLHLLQTVADYKLVSLKQLAGVSEKSPKSVRRFMRQLFDHGLVEVVPVARFALPGSEPTQDGQLLYGSAPNVYVLTNLGAATLKRAGLADASPLAGRYGPRNTLFLAHELAIRDVRVWLELTGARDPVSRLERWEDGPGAEIAFCGPRGRHKLFPDAWFIYRLGGNVLVGLLELDRDTERGERRWAQKVEGYSHLLASGSLQAVTGYQRARILTFAPDARRRETLAQFVERTAPADLVGSFWFTAPDGWAAPGLQLPYWRRAGTPELQPLLDTPAAGQPPL